LQVFQHGDRATVDKLFERSRQALKPGGWLFLRVNSVNTSLGYSRKRVEGTAREGYTVRYLEGPKEGQLVHFYSAGELGQLALRHGFDVIHSPEETTEYRKAPMSGTWKQWETIWQKPA
jgi:hypothetical protein